MDVITDSRALHGRALGQAVGIVARVRPEQMGSATPCAGWDVRALLNHMVGGNLRTVGVADRKPLERGEGKPDLLGDDPAAAYRSSAEAVKEAWAVPGRLEQTYRLPFGEMPGVAALRMHLLETVAHSWDLAKATGQDTRLDPELVEAAFDFARSSLGGERPPGMPFDQAVTVPDDASAADKLAAFLGRRP